MKRNFFLAAAASSFLLAGPAFAQQQEDKNAQVKLNKQEITQLQQKLDQKGFNVGKADGIWGPKTSRALKEFQKQNNLPATGMSDQQTLGDLGINLSMQNNSNASAPQNTGRSVSPQRPRKGSNPQQNMEPSGSSDTSPSNPSSGGNGNM
jgi:peptidoglycan hydrolase-like protein with peptidoglycan-binding domain